MLRDVTIHAVANGFVVTVGCQTFVFQDRVVMLRDIGEYLIDPEGTEKRYREREPNMKYTLNGPAQAPPTLAEVQRDEAYRNEAAFNERVAAANRVDPSRMDLSATEAAPRR